MMGTKSNDTSTRAHTSGTFRIRRTLCIVLPLFDPTLIYRFGGPANSSESLSVAFLSDGRLALSFERSTIERSNNRTIEQSNK
jgi:hypothetical protein